MGPPMGGPPADPSTDPMAIAAMLGPPAMAAHAALSQNQLQAAIAGAMMATNQASPDQLAAQGQPTTGAPVGFGQ
jgi:hypothetical protein